MAKRITINEIDRFCEKLEKAESNNAYILEQKQHALACLNNMCRELEYNEKKSMRLKEE